MRRLRADQLGVPVGLVVVALFGIIKGVRVAGPGGMTVEMTTIATIPMSIPGRHGRP
ncbi:hypothetical protein [Brevundimonas sp. M20]|uniref:hypothetical protein n=1 Tax=Brevundimonas sp. M20 TaxID=2591463 RepID=UPI00143D3F68|nr:hypothetical protein [Brevundimonas sp. M20]